MGILYALFMPKLKAEVVESSPQRIEPSTQYAVASHLIPQWGERWPDGRFFGLDLLIFGSQIRSGRVW